MLDEVKSGLSQLKIRSFEIFKMLDIPAKEEEVKILHDKTSEPSLWNDPKEAQKLLQKLKSLETQIKLYHKLKGRLDDLEILTDTAIEEQQHSALPELTADLDKLTHDISSLELTTLFSGEYDRSNAIVSINAGAGGTDAQDWAEILLRMYTRWAEARDFKVEVADISYGEEAGLKGCTIIVTGDFAYGYLKAEKGIHRLVRMSPFNADQKRQTSFASVEVIPEIADDIKVEIDPGDLRIDTFRAGGPGGQNVNKVSSAIRITHIPTGVVTQSQNDRSQHANKESAMKILKAKLYEMMLEEHKEKIEELRGQRKDIGWGNQIRSYVFAPYTLVKDHRTGVETSSVQKVIDGDIDLFIEAFLKSGNGQSGGKK